jgi:ATP-dependent DNA helicase PIF1
MQLILIGDPMQLPPVRFNNDATKLCFHSLVFTNVLETIVTLSTQHRHASDSAFQTITSQVRTNTLQPEQEMLLLSRTNAVLEPINGIAPLHVYVRNDSIRTHNERELSKLPGQQQTYLASDHLLVDHYDMCRVAMHTHPVQLILKVGAQVILRHNIDPSKGLANGSRGVVLGFTTSQHLPVVQFQNGYKHIVKYHTMKYSEPNTGKVILERTQLPLNLSWAITFHMCQGMTTTGVVLHCQGIFEKGMFYTGLTRCHRLDQLSLVDFNKNRHIIVCDAAKQWCDKQHSEFAFKKKRLLQREREEQYLKTKKPKRECIA